MPAKQIEPRTLTVNEQLALTRAMFEQRRLQEALLATGLTPTQHALLEQMMYSRFKIREVLGLSEALWDLLPPSELPANARRTATRHRRPPVAL